MEVNGTSLPNEILNLIAIDLPLTDHLTMRELCPTTNVALSYGQSSKTQYARRFGHCPHLHALKGSINWIQLFIGRILAAQAAPQYTLQRIDNCRVLPAVGASGIAHFQPTKSTFQPVSAEIMQAFANQLFPAVTAIPQHKSPFSLATSSYTPPCCPFDEICPTITTKFFYVDPHRQLNMMQQLNDGVQTKQISDSTVDRCHPNESIVSFMERDQLYVATINAMSVCVWNADATHSSPLWRTSLTCKAAIRHFSCKESSFLLLDLQELQFNAGPTLQCWRPGEQEPRWQKTFLEQNKYVSFTDVISMGDHARILLRTTSSLFLVNALTGEETHRFNLMESEIRKSVLTTWKQAPLTYFVTEDHRLACWDPNSPEVVMTPSIPNKEIYDISISTGRRQLWVLSKLIVQEDTEEADAIYSLLLENYNFNLEFQQQWVLQENVLEFVESKLATFTVLDESLVQVTVEQLSYLLNAEEVFIPVATYTLTPKATDKL